MRIHENLLLVYIYVWYEDFCRWFFLRSKFQWQRVSRPNWWRLAGVGGTLGARPLQNNAERPQGKTIQFKSNRMK